MPAAQRPALARPEVLSVLVTGWQADGLHPRRAPPLYNLASSKRSGSESAGTNIRNLKGVFAEWESDADEII